MMKMLKLEKDTRVYLIPMDKAIISLSPTGVNVKVSEFTEITLNQSLTSAQVKSYSQQISDFYLSDDVVLNIRKLRDRIWID